MEPLVQPAPAVVEGALPCRGDAAAALAYRRLPPAAAGRCSVMFLPGFRSSMAGRKGAALEAAAASAGREMVRFDYRGHGASTGAGVVKYCVGDWIADALQILDEVASPQLPVVLVGASMGAWIACRLAAKRPARIAGLVGAAAAPDFPDAVLWRGLASADRDRFITDGRWLLRSQYSKVPYEITMRFLEEARMHNVLHGDTADGTTHCHLKLGATPVRLIHGTADSSVPWELSLRLLEALDCTDATLMLVKAADHRLSSDRDLLLLGAAVDELCSLAEH